MPDNPNPILSTQKLSVANIGVDLFADALRQQSVKVVEVSWKPPAHQDEDLLDLLDSLI